MQMSAGLGPFPRAQALGVSATAWTHREGELSFREAATCPERQQQAPGWRSSRKSGVTGRVPSLQHLGLRTPPSWSSPVYAITVSVYVNPAHTAIFSRSVSLIQPTPSQKGAEVPFA